MLKKLLVLAFIALPLCVSAQELKFATVNLQEIFQVMPETAAAQEALQEKAKKYENEIAKMEEELKTKYNALAEEYYTRYPNLIESQEEGRIWASFEILGMAERTASGIVSVHPDNISYSDNSDYKNNWSIMLNDETWELG